MKYAVEIMWAMIALFFAIAGAAFIADGESANAFIAGMFFAGAFCSLADRLAALLKERMGF